MGTANLAAGLVGVSKRYGANVALDRVSLGIQRGKVTALLGPNGAGKSTAVALLLGLARADEGTVELFGQSPQVLAARRRMGVMLQTAGLVETLRVRELVELTSSYYPRPRAISEVAEMAGIGGLLGKSYGALSGGQQRRVQFALAICGRPELLFLDEPTTGLDIEARESLWAVVRGMVAQGCAVLLTTHYLEEAEALAHRVEVLVRGRIVAAGTVDEIRAMGVRRRIRCVSSVRLEEVWGWPGVEKVTSEAARAGGDRGMGEVGERVRAEGVEGAGGAEGAGWAEGAGGAGSLGGTHSAEIADQACARRRLEISAVEPESVVRRLLERDPGLSELEVARAGLAEAFVRITQGPMHASDELAREGARHASHGEGREAEAWADREHAMRAQRDEPRYAVERAMPGQGAAIQERGMS